MLSTCFNKDVKRLVAALSVTLAIVGCGTVEPKISESDILSAERNGTLSTLYTQVRDGKGLGQSLKAADRAAYLNKIGARLAAQASQKIMAMVNQSRLTTNEVPLSILEDQSSQVETMRSWDPDQYQTTVASLNDEIAATEKAIALKKAVFEAVGIQDLMKKNQLLTELKALHGNARSADLAQLGEQLVSDSFVLVNQWVSDKEFDQAITQLKLLLTIVPDQAQVNSKLADIESTSLVESFISYVRDGQSDKANKLLDLIASGPYFTEQKEQVLPAALELANYYVAMAVEATGEENLVDAYRLFTQSRRIKGLFGLQLEEVTQESDFIDFVYQLYEQATSKKAYGLALGYLSVIEQLRPQFPEMENFKRSTTENVMNEAIKRVTTSAFNGNEATLSLGHSIASKITQYIFDTLPKDVKVVERDQLNAVLREQEINALQNGTGVQLDSADLLIQGTILESNVETTKDDSSRKQRVVTESKQVPNLAYQNWLQMSSSEKERNPQPPRTVIKETKEDIDIKVTYMRKVAVLSISYRVVDAKSARVLYADSVMDKKKVADETTEGVQLGAFTAEAKIAELPSDSELLSDLTVILTQRIGNQVVELLKDPEIGYEKAGQKLFDERNFVGATEEIAKALVMSESKNKDISQLTQWIRQYAVAARLEN